MNDELNQVCHALSIAFPSSCPSLPVPVGPQPRMPGLTARSSVHSAVPRRGDPSGAEGHSPLRWNQARNGWLPLAHRKDRGRQAPRGGSIVLEQVEEPPGSGPRARR